MTVSVKKCCSPAVETGGPMLGITGFFTPLAATAAVAATKATAGSATQRKRRAYVRKRL